MYGIIMFCLALGKKLLLEKLLVAIGAKFNSTFVRVDPPWMKHYPWFRRMGTERTTGGWIQSEPHILMNVHISKSTFVLSCLSICTEAMQNLS